MFDQAAADEICERLAKGEPYAAIRRSNPDRFPARQRIGEWRRANPEFDKAYGEARDHGFDAIAEDCLDIADDNSRDYVRDQDGNLGVDRDHIQRSKLRVETRLKLLAKWDPRRYGDKVQTEHSGGVAFALNIHESPRT